MQSKVLLSVAMLAATAASSHAATVVVDQFDTPTLNPMWTLGDAPGNYASGGYFAPNAIWYGLGNAVFNGLKAESYGNLRASLGSLGASDSARVDSKMMMRYYGAGRWSEGVAIYFDNDNWIQLREAYSGGEAGWVRQGVVNGVQVDQQDSGPDADMRFRYVLAGVELTPTQVKFYGSTVGSDHTSATPAEIGAESFLIPELTMARPASFVGNAYAIVGKGYGFSGFGMNSPFLTNSSGITDPVDSVIDFVQLTTPDVPEPTAMSVVLAGTAALLKRRRVR